VPGTREEAIAETLAFVRSGYALWNAGDIQGVADMWCDDIEWQNPPDWPGQREYHGREAVVRFLEEEVANVIELGDIEVESIEVYGDELLIRLLARTRGQDSRLDIGKVTVFHVARVEDGKIARVCSFLDERQALGAARAAGH
jgi:ketosteroid isomerase-like protein